ncbi:CDP-diacylglycerol--serine O-phosphatidyltransferase [Veillonellaceae bacterium M2-4]|nr:CDP-diacylglycerol--serine O-phosphatidyltransferase [Veillonellaceae bacterium M2-4]
MKKVIPCLFTSGNLAFGLLSMIMTLHGAYTWAGICILIAMFCDACDGRAARALGVAGEFGKELDSLSDVVSFGAAAAFLIYGYSLQQLGWWGVIPPIIYAALGGIRLARFNLNAGVVHGYFQGMPIPNGGGIIAMYAISGVQLSPVLIAVLVILLGYHLVSNVHNPDFKGKSPDTLHVAALIVAVFIGIVILVGVDWHLVFIMPFFLYIIFGLVNTVINCISTK